MNSTRCGVSGHDRSSTADLPGARSGDPGPGCASSVRCRSIRLGLLGLLLLGILGCREEGEAGPGPVLPGAAELRLNEATCHGEDWVELVSLSGEAVEFAGWQLTDDPADPAHRLLLPPTLTVAPLGFVLAGEGQGALLRLPFGLSCGRDQLQLLRPDGSVADRLTLPAELAPGLAWGRLPDGTGDWGLVRPTPGAANRAVAKGEARLNEVSCLGEEDWIELVVPGGEPLVLDGWRLAEDPAEPEAGWPFPAGTRLAPGEFLVAGQVAGQGQPFPFGLRCGREAIHLLRPDGTVADTLELPDQTPGMTWGRLPDGTGEWSASRPTPGRSNAELPEGGVLIAEVGCHGEADWVELLSQAAAELDLEGWVVTDAPAGRPFDRDDAYVFPRGATLPPGGRLVVGRGTPDDPELHALPFGLACGRDQVRLLRPDDLELDALTLPEVPRGLTWGRLPPDEADWGATRPTPGEPNALPPPTSWRLAEVQCQGPDWVELRYVGPEPGSPAGFWLTDDLSEPAAGVLFPADAPLLEPGARLLLHEDAVAPGASEEAPGGPAPLPLPFGISCQGETLYLVHPEGWIADQVAVETGGPARSWAWLPDDATAEGAWSPGLPTPGQPNRAPVATEALLSEVNCQGDGEWIELLVVAGRDGLLDGWVVTDDPDDLREGHVFPPGTLIPEDGRVLLGLPPADSLPFGLDCDADTLTLLRPDRSVADAVPVPEAEPGLTWARVPEDNPEPAAWQLALPTPGEANVARPPAPVLINEVQCRHRDWVELVAQDPEEVDLEGWSLTQDPFDPAEGYTFPAGVRLGPGELLLLAEQTPEEHDGLPFGLACGRDPLYLLHPDGWVADRLEPVPAGEAVADTWGRLPDGGAWAATLPTPGEPNQPPVVIQVRLNEVACRQGDEWIELTVLPGDEVGRLDGWSVTDDPRLPGRGWVFPPGSAIPADGRILLGRDPAHPLPFSLGCGTDTLVLLRPDGVTLADSVPVPDLPLALTWGRLPDRLGGWALNRPTPGQANRPPGAAGIRLNEVNCRGEDWVELVSDSVEEEWLDGWLLTDDPEDPGDGLRFPAGTRLAPGGLLLIGPGAAGPTGLPFGLRCGADRLVLYRPDGSIADDLSLPEVPLGTSWGRLPDGAAEWTAVHPTPGRPNAPLPTPALVINEVECQGRDWIEVGVLPAAAEPVPLDGWILTDDPELAEEQGYRFPPGLLLAPGERRVAFQRTLDEEGLAFGVACGEETLYLLHPDGHVADELLVPAAQAGVTWGRLPDLTAGWAPTLATPGAANRAPVEVEVRLNEVSCRGGDWVELHVRSGREGRLDGWRVTDDPADPGEGYRFPPGTEIPADGLLLVGAVAGEGDAGGARGEPLPFGIACGADVVYLLRPDGRPADWLAVQEVRTGLSWGRLPDGSGGWSLTLPTPGRANQAVDPLDLVLNEASCRGQQGEEWVELVNRSAQAGRLDGWVVTDDPADLERGYPFPAGTQLPPGGRLVVGGPAGPPLPFGLACDEEALQLVRPDGSVAHRAPIRDPGPGLAWGRLPDALGDWGPVWPTPGAVNLPPPEPHATLNEVSCRGDDWVELINRTASPLVLAGWSLAQAADDPTAPRRTFPADEPPLPPGGLRLVPRQGPDHPDGLPFGLGCGDEAVYLLRPDGLVADWLELPDLLPGQTWGRLPDGDGPWGLTVATPGAANELYQDVEVRLNELDCRGDEWIELTELGGQPARLDGWRLSDDPASDGWRIPDGTRFDAAGRLLIEQASVAGEAGFPFALACGEETLFLLRPDGTLADSVLAAVGLPAFTWGRLPDGEGEWTPTEATPGQPNAPPGDPAAELFDPALVHRVELILSEQAIASLRAAPYVQVEGGFRFTEQGAEPAGQPLRVGVRIKGRAGSLRTIDQKCAFKVNLDAYEEDQRFRGLKMITLNNMVQDSSMIHEWLAYTIFRAMGVPAPRVGYVWVTVNDQPYGLYADLESPDDEWLDRHFPSTQHLYEGSYGMDLFWKDADRFTVDEGDEGNRDDLLALLALAEQPPAEGFFAGSGHLVDWDLVLPMMATEIYIGHWDGYAPTRNNYYFHFDDAGRARLLPWGTDQTFSSQLGLRAGKGLLLQFCMADATCSRRWEETFARLLEVLDGLALDPAIVAQAEVIAPWVQLDPRRAYSPAQVAAAQTSTRNFLTNRRSTVGAWVACLLGPDADADQDGFRCDSDCNNQDPTVHPGALEICGDGIDQDCTGRADDAPHCPDCFEQRRGPHRYLVCTNPRSWADGRAHCQELGGPEFDLAVIDDGAENSWLTAAAVAVLRQDYWLGMTDRVKEGTWVWVDGRTLGASDYRAWNSGEPNNSGDEDCLQLRQSNSLWNDMPCTSAMGVLCESACGAGGEPLDADGDGYPRCGSACNAQGQCGTDCDDGNAAIHPGAVELCWDGIDQDCSGQADQRPPCSDCRPVQRGPHTYYICLDSRNWANARTRCQELGADLAVLDDSAEDAWLYQQSRAVKVQDYWIGLSDTQTEGTFRWVDGRVASGQTFTHWNGGEPNDAGGNEDCAHFWGSNGTWNDLPCTNQLGALCEAPCGGAGEPLDQDGDGFPRCGATCDAQQHCGTDCDDSRPGVRPGAAEVCGDGIDQNCNGQIDEGCGR